MKSPVGVEAVAAKGWIGAHKFLLLRRFSQLSILALFMIGPLFGLWVIKGNLSSSLFLETIPMSDPFIKFKSIDDNEEYLIGYQHPVNRKINNTPLNRKEGLKRLFNLLIDSEILDMDQIH